MNRRKFRIYFEQVNQTRYDVVATTRENAVKTAAKLWREENATPRGVHVEEER
jgi:hypothetical protein